MPSRPMNRSFADRARRHAGGVVVDAFFKSASRLGRLLPSARPEAHGVERLVNLPYTDSGDGMHLLDVYRPVSQSPLAGPDGRLPAILYVHGGGFRMLDKDSHWLPGLIYARRGYVVFNVSYRLAPQHPFPAAIEDVAAAFRWVVARADKFHVDLSRIGLAGESAGANLILSLALCTSFRRPERFAAEVFDLGVQPKAVLPAMGILQVSDPHRFARRKPLTRFLVDRLEEVTDAYLPDGKSHDLADPLLVLERDDAPERPFPIVHACVGTADPILDDTRRLAKALGRRQIAHEVSYWPGGIHAFHMFVFQKRARDCWQEILSFANRHIAGSDEPVRPMVTAARFTRGHPVP